MLYKLTYSTTKEIPLYLYSSPRSHSSISSNSILRCRSQALLQSLRLKSSSSESSYLIWYNLLPSNSSTSTETIEPRNSPPFSNILAIVSPTAGSYAISISTALASNQHHHAMGKRSASSRHEQAISISMA